MSADAPALLADLLRGARVWRGGARAPVESAATGHAPLDEALPGGGWPVGALTEILHDAAGIGEMGLVLPHLARVTQAGGRAAFAGPPHLPFAPALAQAGVVLPRVIMVRPSTAGATLWAAEQMLRSGAFGTVLAWPGKLHERDLRRLQIAAESGRAIGFLFRAAREARHASPAALRLQLVRTPQGLVAEVLKCRGGAPRRLRVAA